MDSGSSGSIQSSSGGEEDYNSRLGKNGFSGFLNNPPPPPLPPTAAAHHSHSPLFDPFSNLFDPLPATRSNQNNSLLNLQTQWPTNSIQLPTASIPTSSSSSQLPQSFMTTNTSTTQLQVFPPNVVPSPPPPAPNLTNNNPSLRNPRKRTRASRRAPTTVLTTDTSNFRAMVQEFTGIPAPPFTPASSFPRARFDLFGATSSLSSPPYLLRPFPQKLSPFHSNSTTVTTTTNSLLSPSSDFLLPKQNHPLPSNSSYMFNLHPNVNLLGSHHLHQNPRPEDFLSENVALPPTWGNCGGGGGGGEVFRSINGKYCTASKHNNNYSASSSSLDFHGEKGSENVITTTTRTQGIIESWVPSSD